mgnify:CR=1 FL=1
MTEKLKPCPFCGGQPEVTTKYEPSDDGDDWRWTFIECPMHRVITSADTWNTRPIEDAQAAEIERLRAALENLLEACYLADAVEELSDYVDGSLLDAASDALKGGE